MIKFKSLSRREREIMDIVYSLEEATAAEIKENMPNPPSYSAVRAMLKILEEKGQLQHKQDGSKYVYFPVVKKEIACKTALNHLVDTFFGGSAENAVVALLDIKDDSLSTEDYNNLLSLIEKAKQEGR